MAGVVMAGGFEGDGKNLGRTEAETAARGRDCVDDRHDAALRAHDALVSAGTTFMQEVKLDRWLPTGWSGPADWAFFVAERGAFVLGDIKTIKGNGVQYI